MQGVRHIQGAWGPQIRVLITRRPIGRGDFRLEIYLLDTVDYGGVDVDEEDCRVFLRDFEGFDERGCEDVARVEVGLGDFAGGAEIGEAGSCA